MLIIFLEGFANTFFLIKIIIIGIFCIYHIVIFIFLKYKLRDFFNNKNISNYKFNLQYLFCGSKEGLIYMAYIIKGKFAKNTKMGYINSVLVIACFSSVIFDFLFIKKPYIIFIPDSEDLD